MSLLLVLAAVLLAGMHAEAVETMTVKRAPGPIVVDGVLDEAGWAHAEPTRAFTIYYDESSTRYHTAAQLLWDEHYLYVAFTMTDRDVWGETTVWKPGDPCLCREEVAEVFIDPDGDGKQYIEIEVNPLGAVMDLVMNRSFAEGGTADFEWTFSGLLVGIGVEGTLNDRSDSDAFWFCELGIPFEELAFSAPDMSFPPNDGDEWRLNLYRYEYDRTGDYHNELSAWSPTDNRGFHAPDKFSRITFSTEPAAAVGVNDETRMVPEPVLFGNSPNPFNAATSIRFELPSAMMTQLEVFSVNGQHIATLVSGSMNAGRHMAVWNGLDESGERVSSGVYFVRFRAGNMTDVHRMLYMK